MKTLIIFILLAVPALAMAQTAQDTQRDPVYFLTPHTFAKDSEHIAYLESAYELDASNAHINEAWADSGHADSASIVAAFEPGLRIEEKRLADRKSEFLARYGVAWKR